MDILHCSLLVLILSTLTGEFSHAFYNGHTNKISYVEHVKGEWSPWNYWTTCSRTCGGGITFRSRYCIHGNTLIDLMNCDGDSRQYSLCNTEDCPDGSVDFRAIQCSMYDDVDHYGVVRQWSPVKNSNDRCVLYCEKQEDVKHKVARSMGIAVDGTACINTNGKGVCVKGHCRIVGCDGMLDSTLRYDSCGECGGNNHSCGGMFSGTFTTKLAEEELFQYYDVVTFQPGASNITVEEGSDVNYLALSVDNQYYLNGEWQINRPGTFSAAGTLFTYERRRDGYEKLSSPGPINTNIKISIIVRTEDPLVTYHFHVPSVLRHPLSTHNSIIPRITATTTVEPVNRHVGNDIAKHDGTKELLDNQGKNKPPKIENKITAKKKKEEKEILKALCGPCNKVKGKIRNFCHSDFVVRAMILDRAVETNMTRYDVQILQTFSNNMMLYSREYMWVPNICNCPRMKTSRDYLIMGDRVQSSNTRENLLVVDRDKMVTRWKPGTFELWDTIQSTSDAKCTKLLRKSKRKT